MRKHGVVLAMCAALLVPAGASAQACLGLPSFVNHPVHIHFAGEFPDSARSYVGGVGAGKDGGLFANLGVGQIRYDGITEKSTLGFLEFGLQVPLGPAQVCPIAGGYFAVGPDEAAGAIKVTTRSASAGGSVGMPFDLSAVRLIPRAAVIYNYLAQDVEEEGVGSTTETINSGVVVLGLGVVFRDQVSVQPVVHIPFAVEGDEPSFGVLASVSLGWPLPGFSQRAR